MSQSSTSTSATRKRIVRRPVHGVLLLDKPLGLSSNQALQKAKWLLRAEKAGHTGTLDPLATGLLPLCFGAATKFSQLHLDADKTYETIVRLGVRTTTDDAEGEVLETQTVHCTHAQVTTVLQQFTGEIAQLPPMYSALKKDGKALYEYARAGIEVERSTRQVHIHSLELLESQLQGNSPYVHLRVVCSKGTYIRTLGADIGKALGCGGHLTMLRRVATGDFDISHAITLEQLEATPDAQRTSHLKAVDSLLQGHTSVTLQPQDAGHFLSGMRRQGDWRNAELVAVYGSQPHAFLGTAHIQQHTLIPKRLLNPIEITQILQQTVCV